MRLSSDTRGALVALALSAATVSLAGACGCGSPDAPRPIDAVAGVVHLHEYDESSHAYAEMVSPPVPLAAVRGDDLTALAFTPARVAGDCRLFIEPACSPACPAHSYCAAPATCAPLPTVTEVDGGEIDVTGSSIVPLIAMTFDGASATYRADSDGRHRIFRSGDTLRVVDGTSGHAFAGALEAPPVAVLGNATPLHFPQSGPLTVSWIVGSYRRSIPASVSLSLTATDARGRYAMIVCALADTGSVDVPEELMSGLPPPPRDVRIDLEQHDDVLLPTDRPGEGVLVHVAQSTFLQGRD